MTSQYSKSSHSETKTRINYPCGPFKYTLTENIVLKHERIWIRRSILRDCTPITIRHFFVTKARRSESIIAAAELHQLQHPSSNLWSEILPLCSFVKSYTLRATHHRHPRGLFESSGTDEQNTWLQTSLPRSSWSAFLPPKGWRSPNMYTLQFSVNCRAFILISCIDFEIRSCIEILANDIKDLFHNIHPKRIISFVHAIGLTNKL